jgi:NADH dehydrogenase
MLGTGRGAFQSGGIGFIGFCAWLIHRAYHVCAVPTCERTLECWSASVLLGCDIASIEDAKHFGARQE